MLLASLLISLVPLPQKTVYHRPSLKVATLDLETGLVRRGPTVGRQSVTTESDFNNLDLGGFIAASTGGGFCEWIDAGEKGTGNAGVGPVASDLVSNFVFAYCSTRLDVRSGGTGGSMTWTFYPSHTTGAPHPATSEALGRFTLNGLPSNTSEGAAFFQIECFFMDVSLGSVPLAFPDGNFGYSWTFEDLDTAGIWAGTFPFLSCVTSCSTDTLDGIGMDDLIDQYCPTGESGAPPQSTFSFGTTSHLGYFTSINIDLREIAVDATIGSYVGGGINEDVLHTSKAIIGQDWTATISPRLDRTDAPGGSGAAVVVVRGGGPPAVDIVLDLAPLLIGFGSAPESQLLHTGPVFGTAVLDHFGAGLPSSAASLSIPLQTSYLCLDWYAQAIVFGDVTGDGVVDLDPAFSTAVYGIVGAQ